MQKSPDHEGIDSDPKSRSIKRILLNLKESSLSREKNGISTRYSSEKKPLLIDPLISTRIRDPEPNNMVFSENMLKSKDKSSGKDQSNFKNLAQAHPESNSSIALRKKLRSNLLREGKQSKPLLKTEYPHINIENSSIRLLAADSMSLLTPLIKSYRSKARMSEDWEQKKPKKTSLDLLSYQNIQVADSIRHNRQTSGNNKLSGNLHYEYDIKDANLVNRILMKDSNEGINRGLIEMRKSNVPIISPKRNMRTDSGNEINLSNIASQLSPSRHKVLLKLGLSSKINCENLDNGIRKTRLEDKQKGLENPIFMKKDIDTSRKQIESMDIIQGDASRPLSKLNLQIGSFKNILSAQRRSSNFVPLKISITDKPRCMNKMNSSQDLVKAGLPGDPHSMDNKILSSITTKRLSLQRKKDMIC